MKKHLSSDGIEQDSLFSFEDLEACDPTSLFGKDFVKGPVTCLGIEFADDDARRAYFRERLREKLPELRHIEGFPIGSDDDIINLSDPPYYTACPNPWLNDFIAEWEAEKQQLEAEGKRRPDFEVTEPYAYPIQVGKNSSIYNAHTYHTKVPHEIIMRYILHYTQPGDIIIDNFAGTGMCGVASSQCEFPSNETKQSISKDFIDYSLGAVRWGKRHAINSDLSPLCFHISSNYNRNGDSEEVKVVVEDILNKLNQKFGQFYKIDTNHGPAHINYFVWSEIVACKNCGQNLVVHDLLFDYANQVAKKDLVCPFCNAIQSKKDAINIQETVFDTILDHSISVTKYKPCLINVSLNKGGRLFSSNFDYRFEENDSLFIPIHKLEGDEKPHPSSVGADYVHQLYSPLTLQVLSYLYGIIRSYDDRLKNHLMFIFTSMLPKLTRMNRYMPQHGSRALVGPMANTVYIPPQYVENNPVDQFECKRTVLRVLHN